MLAITAVGCQSIKVVNKDGNEITQKHKFILNTEATFRPFTEFPSIYPPVNSTNARVCDIANYGTISEKNQVTLFLLSGF